MEIGRLVVKPNLPDAPLFPFSREHHFDPPALYTEIRQQQPIFPVKLWDGRRAWILTRHDHVRAVVTDARFSGAFAHPEFPAVTAARVAIDKAERAFVGMDNPAHGHYRRMFTAEFSVKRMRALAPRIEVIANQLLDAMIAGGSPADLVADFAQKFPALVMCELFGSPYEDHHFIMRCAAGRHSLSQTPATALTSAQELLEYCRQLIERKCAAPGDDMLTRLIDAEVRPDNLSVEEFAHITAMLLRAGHDTTANMISLGTLVLLQHPAELAALRADLSLINGAVEELLRYLSPVQFVPRRVALEDVEIDGVLIRKGEGVFALTPAANRDPTVFSDPGRFDVRRDASGHLAFGFGIHQCLGQILARIELQVVFPLLLQRLPELRVADPEVEVNFKKDSQIVGIYSLPVAW
jgi:cytochrome P450